MKKKAVDWAWANKFGAISIFRAVGLSLGLDLDDVRPVDWPNSDSPAPEFRERVIHGHQAARTNELRRTNTAEIGSGAFDPQAEFPDGQFWEIDLADFRRFCDVMEWKVPAEFLPRGYTPLPAAITPSPETPQQRRARWLAEVGNGERGALARVHNSELVLNPKADRSFIGKQIAKAKREKTEWGGTSNWSSQLVTGGKRTK